MTLSQMFRNIWPYVRPYKWLVIATLFLTFIGSLIAQVNAWILRYAIDGINDTVESGGTLSEGLKVILLVTVVLITKEVLTFCIQFGQKYYGEKLRIYTSRNLSQEVIEKILTYRMAFFSMNNNRPGKLQSRIDRGVDSLTQLMHNFFIDILPLFANAIVAVVIMLKANVYIGLVALLVLPIYYFINRQQAARLKGVRQKVKKLREDKSQGILSILNSMLIIKSFNRQDIETKKQMDLQVDLTQTQINTRKLRFIFEGSKGFVEQIGVAIIIALTSYFILKGEMTIGSIMFFTLLFNNVSAPVRQLHRVYDQMNDALIYSESFFDIINAEPTEKETSGAFKPNVIKGHFSIRNLDFTYQGNHIKTLDNVNMDIYPDQVTAFIGLSGAGKSTLINLLDKFYQPDEGTILLDGHSLEEYNTDYLRDNIGLVLQKNHIFDGSIEDNIRYGMPEAKHEEIVEAAKQAYIHDQIMQLPEQYAGPALNLSGGQQQKIAIARLFLKNPPIVFLDEPTSSLDAISTEQIKLSMDAIKKGRTVIIISHSISQIIDADCIHLIESGRVIQSGTHEDLYRKSQAYKELFDAMARSLNIKKISQSIDQS
ncbi:ABC transporter ATP-binding protein [Bacteroides propionicifaciens]|uniref:ABC transporter ATP-binding protein n=2 Tax=Bacteroides propionicifaciens TaxID=392838 RepID=UPI00037BEB0E|nr:ABC transporter ATP-binding protein [Bacteroides propionicifaciens]